VYASLTLEHPVFPGETIHKLKKGRQGGIYCHMTKVSRYCKESLWVLCLEPCDCGVDDDTSSLSQHTRGDVNAKNNGV